MEQSVKAYADILRACASDEKLSVRDTSHERRLAEIGILEQQTLALVKIAEALTMIVKLVDKHE